MLPDMNLLMVSDERVSLHVQENQNITRKHTQNTVIRHTFTSPAFDFALYEPVQVATLVVFHNKQVKNKMTVSS